MKDKILLICNTSTDSYLGSNLGAMFKRASEDLSLDFSTIDNSFSNYAPSMKQIWGKAFFKLSGKRPIEWWSFNQRIITTLLDKEPKFVLVTGIFPLSDDVFNTCLKINCKIANYLTDYPWNPHHFSKKFVSNLLKYDLVVSTKTEILSELKNYGVKNVKFLPFAYDPFLFYQPESPNLSEVGSFSTDVCFIGMGDVERIPFLEAISSLVDFNLKKLKIYGPHWDRISVNGWQRFSSIQGEDLRMAIYCSKITLGIVRKRNRDQSTMRTFEIAACGGCGIYEDTSEHREILLGYPDYGFFSSPQDLGEKCKWLLENPVELEQMRQTGIKLIVKEDNTYAARLKKILELSNFEGI